MGVKRAGARQAQAQVGGRAGAGAGRRGAWDASASAASALSFANRKCALLISCEVFRRCLIGSPIPVAERGGVIKKTKNPSSRNDTRFLFASGTHVMPPAAAPHAAAVLRPAAAPHAAAVLLIDEGPQVLQHRVHTRGADFASFQVRQSLFLAERGSLLVHRTLWSMPHSSHAVSLWPTLTRPTILRNDLHATQLPKCTHASVRAPQHTRRTKASSSPQSEELRAASMLYSTLRNYRKLGPGNKEKIVQKLCQAVSCVRTNGIAARGSLPSPTLTPDPNPNRVLMS